MELDKLYTGIPDIDKEIILHLSDKILSNVCQLNKYTQGLCNEDFWNRRIQHKFVDLSKYKPNKTTYKTLYKELSRLDIEGVSFICV